MRDKLWTPAQLLARFGAAPVTSAHVANSDRLLSEFADNTTLAEYLAANHSSSWPAPHPEPTRKACHARAEQVVEGGTEGSR